MNENVLREVRLANPPRNGNRGPPGLEGVPFFIDVNDRQSLQGFIRAICLQATDVIRRQDTQRRGGPRQRFDFVDALETDRDALETDPVDAPADRFATARRKLRGIINGTPTSRIPGTLLCQLCNEVAQQIAVEQEKMSQRGLLEICYAKRYFTAVTMDKKKGVLMAKALLSHIDKKYPPGMNVHKLDALSTIVSIVMRMDEGVVMHHPDLREEK